MGPETTFLLLCSHAQHQCGGLCARPCPGIGRMELFFQTPKCSSLLASCRQHTSGTDRTKCWCGLFIVKEISVTEYWFFCHFCHFKIKHCFPSLNMPVIAPALFLSPLPQGNKAYIYSVGQHVSHCWSHPNISTDYQFHPDLMAWQSSHET